jgi:hypothetical protein
MAACGSKVLCKSANICNQPPGVFALGSFTVLFFWLRIRPGGEYGALTLVLGTDDHEPVVV